MLLVRRHCCSDVVGSCLMEQRPCHGLTETVSAVRAGLWLARQYSQCSVLYSVDSFVSVKEAGEGQGDGVKAKGQAKCDCVCP